MIRSAHTAGDNMIHCQVVAFEVLAAPVAMAFLFAVLVFLVFLAVVLGKFAKIGALRYVESLRKGIEQPSPRS